MDQDFRQEQVLQASLHFVDCGLYAVTYRPDPAGWDHHILPVYQLGRCAADAKQCIEMALKAMGYQAVIWTDVLTNPCVQPLETYHQQIIIIMQPSGTPSPLITGNASLTSRPTPMRPDHCQTTGSARRSA